MNAVVAVCHFCEIHGPKILFCTQSFHEDETCSEFPAEFPECEHYESCNNQKLPKKFYGNYEVFIRPSTSHCQPSDDGEGLTETCDACRSINGLKPGYWSNDHEHRISFVSSQYPYHPEVFSVVRQACLRSLSCEVCPGREGPIFFGNDAQGYSISHTFVLKDSKARGFQHWYSLIVVSMDKILLLNSYPFLVRTLKGIIEELQWKALRVYDEEQKKAECPEKTLRLAAGSRFATPTNYLRQRVQSGGSPRSLAELTGDADIFKRLHRHFVWMLKANTHRVTELVLEGSPTEDEKVRLELMEEEMEALEVESRLSSHSVALQNGKPASNGKACTASASAFCDNNSLSTTEKFCQRLAYDDDERCSLGSVSSTHRHVLMSTSPRLAMNFCLNEDPNNATDDKCTQPRVTISYNLFQKALYNLRYLYVCLGIDMFRSLLYHCIVGNQIIFCCEVENVVVDCLNAMQCLIPLGCAKTIYHSNMYEESWKCNLLGLAATASVPQRVETNGLSLLLVAEPRKERQRDEDYDCEECSTRLRSPSSASDAMSDAPYFDSNEPTLADFRIYVAFQPPLPTQLPTVLKRFETVLTDSSLSLELIESAITSIKEEWLSKIKVVFNFTRQKPGYTVEELQRVQTALKVAACDEPIFKFWSAGLSKQFKNFVFSSAKRIGSDKDMQTFEQSL